MDVRAGWKVAGLVLVLAMVAGCAAQESDRDRMLRAFAKEYGMELPRGRVDAEQLATALAANGDREIVGVVAAVKKASAGMGAGQRTEVLTGLLTEARRREELAASNIANERTTGYRRAMVERALAIGNAELARDMRPGMVIVTARVLDLCISGEGFFRVQNDRHEIAYTRNGMLRIDREGTLVVEGGHTWRLDPLMVVPRDTSSVSITPDGRVFTQRPGDASPHEVGQLNLALFVDATKLATQDGVFFTATQGSGDATMGRPAEGKRGSIQSGFLEMSNVDVIGEMLTLIRVHRWVEGLAAALP